MRAKIVTIGTEILIGQIVDTNSAWIASRLNSCGVQVGEIQSISDVFNQIVETLDGSLLEFDIVVVTGGIGPTKDDITKSALCKLFNTSLVQHKASYQHIKTMLEARAIPFNELNQQQALVPEACEVLFNESGTAPGMLFERAGHILISMPGVPFEMKQIFDNEVIPRIERKFKLQSIVHKTAITYGLPESVLATLIAPWEDALPGHIKLAYLPNPNNLRLRLSVYGMDKNEAQHAIDQQFNTLITQYIPSNFLGFEGATLQSVVAEYLTKNGKTLSVAESCTGGAVATRFTAMEGASAYFLGGVVAYSNEVKTTILGVPSSLIAEHGAVSKQVAIAMAEGVRAKTGSHYSIATTGIAGPTGSTADKPVGTVWMAVATPTQTVAEMRIFSPLREVNIDRASSFVIDMLRNLIK